MNPPWNAADYRRLKFTPALAALFFGNRFRRDQLVDSRLFLRR
jgi:hypothetical protein